METIMDNVKGKAIELGTRHEKYIIGAKLKTWSNLDSLIIPRKVISLKET